MFQAIGAARPQAPEAKELCQKSAPPCDPRSVARRLHGGGHVICHLRSGANKVFGLAHVLAEGAGGRPFFLLQRMNQMI